MKYRSIVCFVFLFFCFLQEQNGQNNKNSVKCPNKQVLEEIEQIKATDMYYYGEGTGKTMEIAKKIASADMAQNVNFRISSEGNINIGDKENYSENITFASEKIEYSNPHWKWICKEESNYNVFIYVEKSKIDSALDERTQRIIQRIEEGERNEKSLRIRDALKDYYWAYLLLKQHLNGDKIEWTDSEGTNHYLYSWLPGHIKDIIANLKFSIESKTTEGPWENLSVKVTYKGKKVANCTYSYMADGKDHLVEVNDGIGTVQYRMGMVPQNIQFRVEYEFEKEAKSQNETSNIFKNELTKEPINSMVKAENNIPDEEEAVKPRSTEKISWTRQDSCMAIMNTITSAIKSKKTEDNISQLFTKEGWGIFQKMFNNVNYRVVGDPSFSFQNHDDEIICRSIPMSFTYPKSSKSVTHNVEFILSPDLKIKSLSFMLDSVAENDILRHTQWKEESKYQLIRFLQNYQTAYSLKRIDYIESIYSKDALIIVGTALKKKETTSEISSLISSDIKLETRTKEEYIKRLKEVFDRQEYVNLFFKDNIITHYDPKYGELYGVSIHQYYSSSTYSDQGYLYLFVDLNNPSSPEIHVRVWNPTQEGILSKFNRFPDIQF